MTLKLIFPLLFMTVIIPLQVAGLIKFKRKVLSSRYTRLRFPLLLSVLTVQLSLLDITPLLFLLTKTSISIVFYSVLVLVALSVVLYTNDINLSIVASSLTLLIVPAPRMYTLKSLDVITILLQLTGIVSLSIIFLNLLFPQPNK